MNSSMRTSDMESKPAATRSVSGLTLTSGANTSRFRKSNNLISISSASIISHDHSRPANLACDGRAWQGADDSEASRDFVGREMIAAKRAHGIEAGLGLVQHNFSFDHFTEVRMRPSVNA